MFSNRGIVVAGLGLLLSVSAQAALIGTTPVFQDCSRGGCTWSVRVANGATPVLNGTYTIDSVTGRITLTAGQTTRYNIAARDGGGFVQLNDVNGNADPILGFNASAATGTLGNNFAFNFSMPIALSGPLNANSSVSYSLTSLTSAGAQIGALLGTPARVVIAQEVDTDVGGLPPLDKGVNVGNTFSFVGAPQTQNSPVYTASSSLIGGLAYDRMSVTVAFSLSASSNVGLSGFVQQTPAPVPAAVWLLGSALGVLGWIRRASR